jgi:uncharacterized protein (DUF2384 family)
MEAAFASIAPGVWDHAVDTFGSETLAARWFETPLAELHGKTPIEWLRRPWDADQALRAVDDILTRIDYGVFS